VGEDWIERAKKNAIVDTDVRFILCDASARKGLDTVKEYGPFDLIVVNDVFEHVYDTAGLIKNLVELLSDGGLIYYKVPNGYSTRHVLSEGHKKIFGIGLLNPDYWGKFTPAPFNIYYFREDHFNALFKHFNLRKKIDLNKKKADNNINQTKRHIATDIQKIKDHLKRENFDNAEQFNIAKQACEYYIHEFEADIETMSWDELYMKYRVNHWEAVLEMKKPKRTKINTTEHSAKNKHILSRAKNYAKKVSSR